MLLRPLGTALVAALLVGCGSGDARVDGPDTVDVAVAASGLAAQQELARRFTALTGIPVRTSAGATGQLYAQIRNGAPYHLFLAADTDRPRRLEEEGLAVEGSRFTWAVGRLVLYAPSRAPLPEEPWGLLAEPGLRIAVANPRTAPYGQAAHELLDALDLDAVVAGSLVTGENVGQAFQFVRAGGAEVGLFALSQVVTDDPATYRIVPAHLHIPLDHQAVLLLTAANHEGARRYLDFLESTEAVAILGRYGFEAGPQPAGGG